MEGVATEDELGRLLRRASGGRDGRAFDAAMEAWGDRPWSRARHRENGKGPLHYAAWKGRIQHVEKLVESGCDIEEIATGKHCYGKTPIFFAITMCRNQVVELLVRLGASVLVVNNKGQTPMSLAASHLDKQTCQMVKQREDDQVERGISWREFHTEEFSDGLVYGDLDPRFFTATKDDVVTEFALNPTTRASRKNNFTKNNPRQSKTLENNEKLIKAAKIETEKLLRAAQDELVFSHQLQKAIVAGQVLETAKTAEEFASLITQQLKTRNAIFDAHERLMNWIAKMDQATAQQATTVLREAAAVEIAQKSQRRSQRLRARFLLGAKAEQAELKKQSQSSVEDDDLERKRKHDALLFQPAIPSAAAFETNSATSMLVLDIDLFWVDTAQKVSNMHSILVKAMEACPLLAVDTEWMSDGRLAIVQIAVKTLGRHCCFVVDAIAVRSCQLFMRELDETLDFCVNNQGAHLAGFAFGKDAKLLAEQHPKLPWNKTIDAQLYAIHAGIGSHAQIPSLKRVVEAYGIGIFDKSLQRSNWEERPLTKQQINYAAFDAAVLLKLLEKMGMPQNLKRK